MTHAISETTSNAGDDNVSLDYTNRRRFKIASIPDDKSNETREAENVNEYESVCIRISECFITKPSTVNVRNKSQTSSSRTGSSTSSRHPAIEEFKRFHDERGGHYGGWKEKDHLFFVKIRAKNPPMKTAKIVIENFPDLQEEEVLRHDAWYTEYQRLRAANRRAIEEWKRSRAKELEKAPAKEEEPQPKTQRAKRDPDIKEKIEIWKAKCLATKLERLQEHRLEEMRKLKEEEHRKQMQEQRKMVLNQYLQEKKDFESSLKTAKQVEKDLAKREATKRAKILLRHFRSEDRRHTARQQERAARRRPPEEAPRRSGSRAPRDPLRILRPTLGWTLRTKKPIEPQPPAQPLHIQHLRHLGRPAWRKDIPS